MPKNSDWQNGKKKQLREADKWSNDEF